MMMTTKVATEISEVASNHLQIIIWNNKEKLKKGSNNSFKDLKTYLKLFRIYRKRFKISMNKQLRSKMHFADFKKFNLHIGKVVK